MSGTEDASEMMKRSAELGPDDASRVRHFAEIERNHGDPNSDPRQRAMMAARKEPDLPVDRMLAAKREQ